MSENIDDVTGCVHGLVWGCRDCMIDLLTRELDEAREHIAALEAQLAVRGACECGADDVCALARRAQEAERERDEARRQAAALTEGLRLVSDALARLDQIYRADTDLGDPPVETPAWLQAAQHRAAALLTPNTTPAPETCDRCGEADAEVELGSVLKWCKPCFASAQDEAERTYYPTLSPVDPAGEGESK